MDLIVRELSLNVAAKHPESGALGNMLQRFVALVSHPQVQQPTLKLCQRLASIVAVRLDLVGELRPCHCFDLPVAVVHCLTVSSRALIWSSSLRLTSAKSSCSSASNPRVPVDGNPVLREFGESHIAKCRPENPICQEPFLLALSLLTRFQRIGNVVLLSLAIFIEFVTYKD